MNLRVIAIGVVAIAAVVTLAAMAPGRSSEAHGPDVNGDGYVDLFNDLFAVAFAFGQTVPTPTPIVIQSYVEQGPNRSGSCSVLACVESEAFCDPSDVASGGGWEEPSGVGGSAPSQLQNYPVLDENGNGGWHVIRQGAVQYKAWVVCIDNPPFRPMPTVTPTP